MDFSALKSKGGLACLGVAVAMVGIWFVPPDTSLTLVNLYPKKREVFEVVGGVPKVVGVLAGNGGSLKVEAGDGTEYGWRRVAKKGTKKRARTEETVVVTAGVRPTFVLGNGTVKTTWVSNASPNATVTATRSGTPVAKRTLGPGEVGPLETYVGEFLDWVDAETSELLQRTVVAFPGANASFAETRSVATCRASTPLSTPLRTESYRESKFGKKLKLEIYSNDPFVAVAPKWLGPRESGSRTANRVREAPRESSARSQRGTSPPGGLARTARRSQGRTSPAE